MLLKRSARQSVWREMWWCRAQVNPCLASDKTHPPHQPSGICSHLNIRIKKKKSLWKIRNFVLGHFTVKPWRRFSPRMAQKVILQNLSLSVRYYQAHSQSPLQRHKKPGVKPVHQTLPLWTPDEKWNRDQSYPYERPGEHLQGFSRPAGIQGELPTSIPHLGSKTSSSQKVDGTYCHSQGLVSLSFCFHWKTDWFLLMLMPAKAKTQQRQESVTQRNHFPPLVSSPKDQEYDNLMTQLLQDSMKCHVACTRTSF